ncbi:hypothetical protein HRG_007120 [Hirsutella rhossiliensis]|uniref:Uncharacterized protein n=1 Tax=Hirsutella rhossiliensis TaxID=111463 RepID=A0A9P8MVK4_9HYPO|nr:uncharacterized protein HRG_07120 [Hirsutella rhossiliensis]KAH0962040.1 hypothetical protein HRG_07120 [Hirsutella rhossiliensis]
MRPSDRMPMIPDIRLFSLNLSIYGQPIDPSDWTEEWFSCMPASTPTRSHGRLSNATASSLTRAAPFYTMPALVVRDQGYQPVLPRLFASMGDFPCIPPIVSFTGLIVGTGHSSLRRDLLPGLGAAQLNCCGFVRLSTYVAPGMPNKVPFKGFHPFQVFVIFPVRANPWAILCKVAGLLRHDVMLYPPGSDRDNVFIVVPDSWTFLDKAAAAVTTMAPLLSTPQRQQASSASAAFRDVRAASLSLITPGTLPLSPPPLASASPRPATLRRPGNDIALSLPIRRRSDRVCCIRPR